MKKLWVALLLAAALCVSLAACNISGSSEETTQTDEEEAFTPRLDTEEEVTVNIIGALENFESLEAVISDFNEYYPNCQVLYTGEGSYYSMLETRLVSDDSVGIFMIDNGHYAGNIQDKSANLAEEDIDTSAIQSEALNSCVADDGKLYEIPLAHNTSGLIVNTTLLEKEGLSVPQNYKEFLSACGTLKSKGYTPVQGYPYSVDSGLIRNMILVELSKTYNTKEKMEKLDSGEDGCVDMLLPAFEILSEMYEKGYIDAEVNSTYKDNYDDAILKFFEGDVPFLAATTETFSGTKKRETKSESYAANPFDYEFICAPISEDGAYSYIENWQGFAVNEDCEQKEWAVEFMRFLVTKKEINQLANIKGLPSVALESDDDRFEAIYQNNEDMVYTSDVFFPSKLEDALYWAEIKLEQGKLDAEGSVEEVEELLRTEDFESRENGE